MTGRSALRMRAASACNASSDGFTRVSTRVERPRSMPASALRISPGSEMNTGPVGGVVAILAARRTIRGRSSSRVTSTAHFTSGSAIWTSGPYSTGSIRPWPCSCWPAVRIIGVPVKLALNSEPIALPSPGATWTLQATRRPEARLKPSAMATTRLSCIAIT